MVPGQYRIKLLGFTELRLDNIFSSFIGILPHAPSPHHLMLRYIKIEFPRKNKHTTKWLKKTNIIPLCDGIKRIFFTQNRIRLVNRIVVNTGRCCCWLLWNAYSKTTTTTTTTVLHTKFCISLLILSVIHVPRYDQHLPREDCKTTSPKHTAVSRESRGNNAFEHSTTRPK